MRSKSCACAYVAIKKVHCPLSASLLAALFFLLRSSTSTEGWLPVTVLKLHFRDVGEMAAAKIIRIYIATVNGYKHTYRRV